MPGTLYDELIREREDALVDLACSLEGSWERENNMWKCRVPEKPVVFYLVSSVLYAIINVKWSDMDMGVKISRPEHEYRISDLLCGLNNKKRLANLEVVCQKIWPAGTAPYYK